MAKVNLKVNGSDVVADVPDNTLLVEFLRENLTLTGTHIGCDTSQCGACVVHVDGKSVKSCSVLVGQIAGSEVKTIEGLADGDKLHPMQTSFLENHGLQCGFCTPGMIMTAVSILERHGADVDEGTVRKELEGNLCRCTGYQNIVKSVLAAARAQAS